MCAKIFYVNINFLSIEPQHWAGVCVWYFIVNNCNKILIVWSVINLCWNKISDKLVVIESYWSQCESRSLESG